MKDRIEKIAELLPDGISESGLQEVLELVNSAVEDRVAEEVKILEAKVSGFLRSKIDDLKDVAQQELESQDDVLRGYRVFETIRSLVAQEVENSDVDSVVSQQQASIEELQESIEGLNSQLKNSLHENSILSDKVESLNEDNTNLTESAKLPFKSSESAVVITNDTDSSRIPREAANNIFLTEDVINLAMQEPLKG